MATSDIPMDTDVKEEDDSQDVAMATVSTSCDSINKSEVSLIDVNSIKKEDTDEPNQLVYPVALHKNSTVTIPGPPGTIQSSNLTPSGPVLLGGGQIQSAPVFLNGGQTLTAPVFLNGGQMLSAPVFLNGGQTLSAPVFLNGGQIQSAPVSMNGGQMSLGPVLLNGGQMSSGPVLLNSRQIQSGPVLLNEGQIKQESVEDTNTKSVSSQNMPVPFQVIPILNSGTHPQAVLKFLPICQSQAVQQQQRMPFVSVSTALQSANIRSALNTRMSVRPSAQTATSTYRNVNHQIVQKATVNNLVSTSITTVSSNTGVTVKSEPTEVKNENETPTHTGKEIRMIRARKTLTLKDMLEVMSCGYDVMHLVKSGTDEYYRAQQLCAAAEKHGVLGLHKGIPDAFYDSLVCMHIPAIETKILQSDVELALKQKEEDKAKRMEENKTKTRNEGKAKTRDKGKAKARDEDKTETRKEEQAKTTQNSMSEGRQFTLTSDLKDLPVDVIVNTSNKDCPISIANCFSLKSSKDIIQGQGAQSNIEKIVKGSLLQIVTSTVCASGVVSGAIHEQNVNEVGENTTTSMKKAPVMQWNVKKVAVQPSSVNQTTTQVRNELSLAKPISLLSTANKETTVRLVSSAGDSQKATVKSLRFIKDCKITDISSLRTQKGGQIVTFKPIHPAKAGQVIKAICLPSGKVCQIPASTTLTSARIGQIAATRTPLKSPAAGQIQTVTSMPSAGKVQIQTISSMPPGSVGQLATTITMSSAKKGQIAHTTFLPSAKFDPKAAVPSLSAAEVGQKATVALESISVVDKKTNTTSTPSADIKQYIASSVSNDIIEVSNSTSLSSQKLGQTSTTTPHSTVKVCQTQASTTLSSARVVQIPIPSLLSATRIGQIPGATALSTAKVTQIPGASSLSTARIGQIPVRSLLTNNIVGQVPGITSLSTATSCQVTVRALLSAARAGGIPATTSQSNVFNITSATSVSSAENVQKPAASTPIRLGSESTSLLPLNINQAGPTSILSLNSEQNTEPVPGTSSDKDANTAPQLGNSNKKNNESNSNQTSVQSEPEQLKKLLEKDSKQIQAGVSYTIHEVGKEARARNFATVTQQIPIELLTAEFERYSLNRKITNKDVELALTWIVQLKKFDKTGESKAKHGYLSRELLPKWNRRITYQDEFSRKIEILCKKSKRKRNDEEIHCCHLCGYIDYTGLESLVHHINNVHIGKTKGHYIKSRKTIYICTHCRSCFKNYNAFRYHELRNHLSNYPCYFCGMPKDSIQALVDHICFSHCEFYRCFKCSLRYLGKSDVLEHNKTECKETPEFVIYICVYCCLLLHSLDGLSLHIRVCHMNQTAIPNEFEEFCSTCRHVFFDDKALTVHKQGDLKPNHLPFHSVNVCKLVRMQKYASVILPPDAAEEDTNTYCSTWEFWRNYVDVKKKDIHTVEAKNKVIYYPFGDLISTCKVTEDVKDQLDQIPTIMDILIRITYETFPQLQNFERLKWSEHVLEMVKTASLSAIFINFTKGKNFHNKIRVCCLSPHSTCRGKMLDITVKSMSYRFPSFRYGQLLFLERKYSDVYQIVILGLLRLIFAEFKMLNPHTCLYTESFMGLFVAASQTSVFASVLSTFGITPVWNDLVSNIIQSFVKKCCMREIDIGEYKVLAQVALNSCKKSETAVNFLPRTFEDVYKSLANDWLMLSQIFDLKYWSVKHGFADLEHCTEYFSEHQYPTNTNVVKLAEKDYNAVSTMHINDYREKVAETGILEEDGGFISFDKKLPQYDFNNGHLKQYADGYNLEEFPTLDVDFMCFEQPTSDGDLINTDITDPNIDPIRTDKTGPNSEIVNTDETGPNSNIVNTDETGPKSDIVKGDETGPNSDDMNTDDTGTSIDPMNINETGLNSDFMNTDKTVHKSDFMNTNDLGPISYFMNTDDLGPISYFMNTDDLGPISYFMNADDTEMDHDSIDTDESKLSNDPMRTDKSKPNCDSMNNDNSTPNSDSQGLPDSSNFLSPYEKLESLPKWKLQYTYLENFYKKIQMATSKGKDYLTFPVNCYLCAQDCDSEEDVYEHIVKEHVESKHQNHFYGEKYKCTHCHLVLTDWKSLRDHEVEHHLCEYPCYFCGKGTKNLDDMLQHVSVHHSMLHICVTCGFGCLGMKNFIMHRNIKKHFDKKISNAFDCLYCSICVSSTAILKKHMLRYHVDVPVPNKKERMCYSCRHVFMDPKALSSHLKASKTKDVPNNVSHLLLKSLSSKCIMYTDFKKKSESSKLKFEYWYQQPFSSDRASGLRIVYNNGRRIHYPYQELIASCKMKNPTLQWKHLPDVMDKLIQMVVNNFRVLVVQNRLSLTGRLGAIIRTVYYSREFTKYYKSFGMGFGIISLCTETKHEKIAHIKMNQIKFSYNLRKMDQSCGLGSIPEELKLYVIKGLMALIRAEFPYIDIHEKDPDLNDMIMMAFRTPLFTGILRSLEAGQPFSIPGPEKYSYRIFRFFKTCLRNKAKLFHFNVWEFLMSEMNLKLYLKRKSSDTNVKMDRLAAVDADREPLRSEIEPKDKTASSDDVIENKIGSEKVIDQTARDTSNSHTEAELDLIKGLKATGNSSESTAMENIPSSSKHSDTTDLVYLNQFDWNESARPRGMHRIRKHIEAMKASLLVQQIFDIKFWSSVEGMDAYHKSVLDEMMMLAINSQESSLAAGDSSFDLEHDLEGEISATNDMSEVQLEVGSTVNKKSVIELKPKKGDADNANDYVDNENDKMDYDIDDNEVDVDTVDYEYDSEDNEIDDIGDRNDIVNNENNGNHYEGIHNENVDEASGETAETGYTIIVSEEIEPEPKDSVGHEEINERTDELPQSDDIHMASDIIRAEDSEEVKPVFELDQTLDDNDNGEACFVVKKKIRSESMKVDSVKNIIQGKSISEEKKKIETFKTLHSYQDEFIHKQIGKDKPVDDMMASIGNRKRKTIEATEYLPSCIKKSKLVKCSVVVLERPKLIVEYDSVSEDDNDVHENKVEPLLELDESILKVLGTESKEMNKLFESDEEL